MIHPVEDRERKAAAPKTDAELRLPKRLEGRSGARVAEQQGDHRADHEEEAGRRRPAHEIQHRSLQPMAHRAHQRLGQRAFIPRAFIATAIDEERGRHPRAALQPAQGVVPHPGVGGLPGPLVALSTRRQAQLRGEALQVVRAEVRTAFHQGVVHVPESAVRLRRVLGQLGRLRRQLAVDQGKVPEYVPQAVTEAIAEVRDDLVRGVAVFTGVAAVLDECEIRVRPAEDVIARGVYRESESRGPN